MAEEVSESWEELEDSGVSNLFYLMKNISMNLQLKHKKERLPYASATSYVVTLYQITNFFT